jgi:hypothetical protein
MKHMKLVQVCGGVVRMRWYAFTDSRKEVVLHMENCVGDNISSK